MIIVNLKTPHKTLKDIFNVPLLGPFLILLIALVPLVIAIGIFETFPIHSILASGLIAAMACLLWDLLFRFKFKTVIRIFWLPIWIFGPLVILVDRLSSV